MAVSEHDIRNKLRGARDVQERQLRDPEVRSEWERTAVARALALILVRYRSEHGLSQSALASMLGMKQPAIARLERGDRPVTMDTLFRVIDGLRIPFVLEFAPEVPANGAPVEPRQPIRERIDLPHGGHVKISAG